MEARYPFVALDVDADRSDELGAVLFELGAQGLEERDDGTLVRGVGAGRVTLVASFVDHAAADEAMAALRELDDTLTPRLEEVVGDAWRDAWKEHFSPFALTADITIAPPWVEAPTPEPGRRVLVLEPGRAFGTGLHATTALVAEVLHDRRDTLAGREVLDLGTGSGILALVALVYGSGPVLAVDNDADVIEVVRENAERNGLGASVTAEAGTLASVKRRFPWVLANIEARVLLPLADELARAVEPGGTLVLSGILAPEEDRVRERYLATNAGLRHLDTKRRGAGEEGWVAIAFARGT